MQADAAKMPEQKGTHRPFYYGLLTLVLIICIITGGYIYTASVDNRLSMLETITDKQTSELSEMRERVFSSTLQEGRYASLNARMTALTDAFSSLDNKLTQLISQRLASTPAQTTPTATGGSPILITSLTQTKNTKPTANRPREKTSGPAISGEQSVALAVNPEAATPIVARPAEAAAAMAEDTLPQPAIAIEGPTTESVAKAGETADQPASAMPARLASTGTRETATQAPARRTSAGNQGPWVINLLSSTDKGYVEQYAARARSSDVAVEIHRAEVKGRTYWRLQITGFATASAAKAGAGPVKEKLGIRDVWIHRH
jgi:hypothetical protein